MYTETAPIEGTPQSAAAWFPAATPEPVRDHPCVRREQTWRQPCARPGEAAQAGPILVSRWTDERHTARQERCAGATDRYVIGVALRAVRARIGRGSTPVFEGLLPAGMVHVTEPGRVAEAVFFSPCDFIHFHVTDAVLRDRQSAAWGGAGARSLHDLLVRDELAAQLSRTLTRAPDGGDPLYAESIGQTILMRMLASRPTTPRVGKLPKWRLRRVQEHLAANISEPISLGDLADAAGLSRMHFAAQFREATGCKPHHFVLQHRIERAKEMLAGMETPLVDVALGVGFQSQSHFSTVFKRLVGETPARWQRAQRCGVFVL